MVKTKKNCQARNQQKNRLKKFNFIDGFETKDEYFFHQDKEAIFKQVFYYLVESKSKEVKISYEHKRF